MSDVHGDRRDPSTPDGPVGLSEAADEILAKARELSAGRHSRTLTPGAGAGLSQTLLGLTAGVRLDDHRAPGPSTIQILRGTFVLSHDGTDTTLEAGDWATVPVTPHGLRAETDGVALLTVAPRAAVGG